MLKIIKKIRKTTIPLLFVCILALSFTGCGKVIFAPAKIAHENANNLKTDEPYSEEIEVYEDDEGIDVLCRKLSRCGMYDSEDQCLEEYFARYNEDKQTQKCYKELDTFYWCMSEQSCEVIVDYYGNDDNYNAPEACKDQDQDVAWCAAFGLFGL